VSGDPELERALKVLGPLEGRIMRAVWSGSVGATFVVRDIQKVTPELAYTTLMTTLSRLAEKGVLTQTRVPHQRAFEYRAAGSPTEFLAAASREYANRMLPPFPASPPTNANPRVTVEDAPVKILVPATSSTDSPIVQHASHHHFGTMLKRGIRVFEYQPTLSHQKLMIIDGLWSCVGSTNFDARSFLLNDEISMGVVDANIASQLRAAFNEDLKHARERHFDEWSHRPLWHKLIDGLAYLAHGEL